jgi:hypothetical protein
LPYPCRRGERRHGSREEQEKEKEKEKKKKKKKKFACRVVRGFWKKEEVGRGEHVD